MASSVDESAVATAKAVAMAQWLSRPELYVSSEDLSLEADREQHPVHLLSHYHGDAPDPGESVEELMNLPSKGDPSSSVNEPLGSLASGDGGGSTESCSSTTFSTLHWSAPTDDDDDDDEQQEEEEDNEHRTRDRIICNVSEGDTPLQTPQDVDDEDDEDDQQESRLVEQQLELELDQLLNDDQELFDDEDDDSNLDSRFRPIASPTLLQEGALARMLDNVDYISAMEIASANASLSTIDEPITKDVAKDVFCRRVVPLEISVDMQHPEDVSTINGSKHKLRNSRDAEYPEDDELSITSMEGDDDDDDDDDDIELGLAPTEIKDTKPDSQTTTHISVTVASSSSVTRHTIWQRYCERLSRVEMLFLALAVGSTITLIVIVAVVLSG